MSSEQFFLAPFAARTAKPLKAAALVNSCDGFEIVKWIYDFSFRPERFNRSSDISI